MNEREALEEIKFEAEFNGNDESLKRIIEENEKLTIQNRHLNTALGARANGKKTFIDLAVENDKLTQKLEKAREVLKDNQNCTNCIKYQNGCVTNYKECANHFYWGIKQALKELN